MTQHQRDTRPGIEGWEGFRYLQVYDGHVRQMQLVYLSMHLKSLWENWTAIAQATSKNWINVGVGRLSDNGKSNIGSPVCTCHFQALKGGSDWIAGWRMGNSSIFRPRPSWRCDPSRPLLCHLWSLWWGPSLASPEVTNRLSTTSSIPSNSGSPSEWITYSENSLISHTCGFRLACSFTEVMHSALKDSDQEWTTAASSQICHESYLLERKPLASPAFELGGLWYKDFIEKMRVYSQLDWCVSWTWKL